MRSTALAATFMSILAMSIPASAGSHHGGSHSGYGESPAYFLGHARGGAGMGIYGSPYYFGLGAGGMPIAFVSPLFMGPGGILPFMGPPWGMAGWNGNGVAGPLPPRGLMPRAGLLEAPKPRKSDPTRSRQLMTYGDRLFRAGNYHRAFERFEQAARADPHSAAPRVRLAQVAIVRGQYQEAANALRDAETAQPGWLTRATDIQSIYGEPGDFARQIARLESHLQAEPTDRDAWLVLGAQWYLSGRTERAADVFLRLSDRQPDAALAAFLDASRPADRAR